MTSWYVIKLKPGAMRQAPARQGLDLARRGECLGERSIRDLGLECYLPRYRREIVHHRRHVLVTKSFPLFSGYLFAAVPAGFGWGRVNTADHIAGPLGFGGVPMPLPPEAVDRLRAAEAGLEWDDTREARIRRRVEGRTRKETARLRFRPGMRAAVTSGAFASFEGVVESILSTGDVRVALELFGRATPVIVPIDAIRRVA